MNIATSGGSLSRKRCYLQHLLI